MLCERIFIDFDGVILDTEERIVRLKDNCPNLTWDEFLDQLDWFLLLSEAKVINNAVDCIMEAQNNKQKEIFILTKIHTLLEMQAKATYLRNAKVQTPVLFVPPHVKKSQIYLPANGEILIDDDIKNLVDWEESGGKGIYFNQNNVRYEGFETVKSLSKIL